jgi:hypothetical protein
MKKKKKKNKVITQKVNKPAFQAHKRRGRWGSCSEQAGLDEHQEEYKEPGGASSS